ncbi:MAG: WYL domain-containing protein [Deltaproteobacteria bacterium]|nr:WYL domain-containing protein [Deltaproteobacteria bacterium]
MPAKKQIQNEKRTATYPAATRMADLMLLLSKARVSMPLEDVCNELCVSERTARRYKKALDDYFRDKLGYDRDTPFTLIEIIRSDASERWALRLPEEERPDSFQRVLSVYVAMLLLKSLESTVLQEGLHELWQHASGTMKPADKHMLANIDRKFRCTGFGRKSYCASNRVLEDIVTCLIHQRKLQIEHREPAKGKIRHRIIHPYTLLLHRDSLYVHAWDESRSAVRTYLIDRIQSTLCRDESFRYPAGYNPDGLTNGSFGIFQSGEEKTMHLRLRCQTCLKEYLTSRFWNATQRFIDEKGGTFIMEVHLTNLEEFIPWVLQFGSDVEVLEPPQARAAVGERLRDAANLYKG